MRLQATRRHHGRRASRFKGGLPGSAVEAGRGRQRGFADVGFA